MEMKKMFCAVKNLLKSITCLNIATPLALATKCINDLRASASGAAELIIINE
ncbi:hypothetical protein AB0T27_22550 [Escherichia coli]|nr:hypothetical protein [Escherichia coli]HCT5460802.1 hypothetical protein [Escherichia coli]